VIRRLFWLLLGAVAGITGYRRMTALARVFRGTRGRGRPVRGARVRAAAGFARDVREGMELYMDRHPPRQGPTLGVQDTDHVKDDR